MSNDFEIFSRDSLDVVPSPKWLIDGLIMRNSYNLLVGARGSFKSFVGLDIALSVATGGEEILEELELPDDWQGCWPVIEIGAQPVLYVAGEGFDDVRFGARPTRYGNFLHIRNWPMYTRSSFIVFFGITSFAFFLQLICVARFFLSRRLKAE